MWFFIVSKLNPDHKKRKTKTNLGKYLLLPKIVSKLLNLHNGSWPHLRLSAMSLAENAVSNIMQPGAMTPRALFTRFNIPTSIGWIEHYRQVCLKFILFSPFEAPFSIWTNTSWNFENIFCNFENIFAILGNIFCNFEK